MLSLTTYRRPAASLAEWVDGFLDSEAFGWPATDSQSVWSPRVDIVEDKDAYRLHADLPGLAREDVKVTVENGVLTLSGERKAEKREKKGEGYEYYERTYGSFSRSFRLPDNVDPAGVKASHKNGVLELTLPKREEAKPKAIEVKVE
jgi:HSP20 family protein